MRLLSQYDRIFMPCFECYDFEAAVAHEVGHVLGFGHPDEEPTDNLVGACSVTNATCRRPFDCASLAAYTTSERSIMHSLTRQAPRTCLSNEDMHGLYLLYPLCDALQPTTVSCIKGRRLSGWLRLAIVVGVPFLLAVVVILVPLTCLRWRDKRRMRHLDKELGRAHDEIAEYRTALTHAMRSTVRDAISRPATALQNSVHRPSLSRKSSRVHPANIQVQPARPAQPSQPGRPAQQAWPAPAAQPVPVARAQRRSGAATDKLMLEDVAEEHAGAATAVQPKPSRAPIPGGARPGVAKPASGQTARSQGALNGYTGVAWPVGPNS